MGVFFILFLIYGLQALSLTCNGLEKFCDKRIDEISFATAHNAMSSAQDDFLPPDHFFGLTKQFHDGIRAFSIDLHPFKHTIYLCHSYCTLGKITLFDWLMELKPLLHTNPNDSIIIIFESYCDPEAIAQIFDQAGMLDFLHTQPANKDWPTLRQLSQSGRRIIIFTNQIDEKKPAWQHNQTQFLMETEWNVKTVKDFNCEVSGQRQANSLYRLYNIRIDPFVTEANSKEINSNPFLIDRLKKCQKDWEHIPNLVEVAFYSQGDLFKAVQEINSMD